MIASKRHNFIFIKTRKTAGTSVEIVLSSWCGDEDTCPPIHPDDELIRAAFGGRPRNFAPLYFEREYLEAVARGDKQKMDAIRPAAIRQSGLSQHMPAVMVREKFPDLWERAFKFTVERHPYEKVVSRAYWRLWQDKRTNVEDYIDAVIEDPGISDRNLYTQDGRIIVDEIIPFENLWARLAELGAQWGQSLPDPLPRSKGAQRRDRRPARDILTAAQRARVAEQCAFEFDLMGYDR